MPDGNAFNEVEACPTTEEKGHPIPNILRTNHLVDCAEYLRCENLVQSGKVPADGVPGTQGIAPEIYSKYQMINKFFTLYGHKGVEYVREQAIAQSGPIQYNDFANVKRVREAVLFFSKAYRRHIVADMVKHQTTQYLDFSGIRFTPPDNQDWEGMGFYSLPEMTKGSYELDSQALKSHAYVFSITEDFYFNDYMTNPVADHQNALNNEIDLVLHKKVANALKALVAGGATDWDTLNASNVIHDTDPSFVVANDINTIIRKDRANPVNMLTTWLAIDKYGSNSYISGSPFSPGSVARKSIGNDIIELPKLPGVKVGYDDLMEENGGADHRYIVFDPNFFILGLGPRRVAAVNDPITGTRTNAVRYWCGFDIWDWGTPAEIYYKRTVT